jgi:hypothetical protein
MRRGHDDWSRRRLPRLNYGQAGGVVLRAFRAPDRLMPQYVCAQFGAPSAMTHGWYPKSQPHSREQRFSFRKSIKPTLSACVGELA